MTSTPRQLVIPTLRMTDETRSRAFYVEGLGFHVDWTHRFEPGLPALMQLTRDGMTFYLSQHVMDCALGGLIHCRLRRRLAHRAPHARHRH